MPEWTRRNDGPDPRPRRSQRVILSVAVTVSNEGPRNQGAFEEQTRTLVVNAHGALVALGTPVEKGEALRLNNPVTRQESVCKVVYVGTPQEGKFQVGVEFVSPSPDFWPIRFPPDDWKGPDPHSTGAKPAVQTNAKV